MEPIISVVVPIYNVEKYLRQCVDSILSQGVEEIEILLIDDGSTDGSEKICDEYAATDGRIQVVHQQNAGLSMTRNVGIKKAQGRYLCFIDSDDFWLEGYLKKVVELITTYDVDVVCGKYDKYYDGKPFIPYEGISGIYFKEAQQAFVYLLKNGRYEPGACALIVKMAQVKENKYLFTRGIYCEDIDLMPRILLDAKTVYYQDQSYYCYRQGRAGKITVGNYEKRSRDLLSIIQKWQLEIQKPIYTAEFRREYGNYLAYQYAIVLGMVGLLEEEKRYQLWNQVKEQKAILNCAIRGKAKLVKVVASIFGLRFTAALLGQWIKRK